MSLGKLKVNVRQEVFFFVSRYTRKHTKNKNKKKREKKKANKETQLMPPLTSDDRRGWFSPSSDFCTLRAYDPIRIQHQKQ